MSKARRFKNHPTTLIVCPTNIKELTMNIIRVLDEEPNKTELIKSFIEIIINK